MSEGKSGIILEHSVDVYIHLISFGRLLNNLIDAWDGCIFCVTMWFREFELLPSPVFYIFLICRNYSPKYSTKFSSLFKILEIDYIYWFAI